MSQPLRILICDDNVDVARTLALWLEIEGHEVRVVHNGPAALETAQETAAGRRADGPRPGVADGRRRDGAAHAARSSAWRTCCSWRSPDPAPTRTFRERARPALICIWSSRRRWRSCGKCWRGRSAPVRERRRRTVRAASPQERGQQRQPNRVVQQQRRAAGDPDGRGARPRQPRPDLIGPPWRTGSAPGRHSPRRQQPQPNSRRQQSTAERQQRQARAAGSERGEQQTGGVRQEQQTEGATQKDAVVARRTLQEAEEIARTHHDPGAGGCRVEGGQGQHYLPQERWWIGSVSEAFCPRSHALRGNARRDALRPGTRCAVTTGRRASRRAFPRRAWERGI